MQFKTVALLALPVLAMAAPSPFPKAQGQDPDDEGKNKGNGGNAGGVKGKNNCDTSATHSAAQLNIDEPHQSKVDDCKHLIDPNNHLINPETDFWSVGADWARIKEYGTCVFSARIIWNPGNAYTGLGGSDVVDLCNDAIKMSTNGKVSGSGAVVTGGTTAAGGEMFCDGSDGKQIEVQWVIAGSNFNPQNPPKNPGNGS